MTRGGLFDDGDAPESKSPARRTTRGAPAPAPPRPEDVEIARALPPSIRLGTSSWSFPGWQGLVWAGKHSESVLSKQGLAAYARHPLMRAVGLDRTHYAPLDAAAFAAHAAQVPADFRFLVKAHEVCTLFRFPTHPRYGTRKGLDNERFLDPEYARRVVVEPAAEGLGATLGCILFQIAPQALAPIGGAAAFIDRLHRFLGALPRGPRYAVEVRNRQLLTPAFDAALQDTASVPCVTSLARMPALAEQAERGGALSSSGPLVVRWMVHKSQSYESALDHYAPFDRLVDEDPETRDDIARLAVAAAAAGRDVLIIINNKAEGSSPLSVQKLARAIRDRGREPVL